MRKWTTSLSIIVILIAGLLLPAWVLAQSTAELTVNDVQVQEGTDTLALDMYLTLDGVAEGVAPQKADFLLDDGGLFPAEISQPSYYVALVLDASGSMRDILPSMQEAAVNLIAQAPPETLFAVIRFDEQIRLIQTFTDDHEQVTSAVNSIEPGESGTCLYDATYTAVQALEQIAGEVPRRALAIFTDGRDERRLNESGACSRHTFEQVLDYAGSREIPIPIYAAGLSANPGRINVSALTQMAEATGGQVAQETQLPDLMQAILHNINRQWAVRVQLQPGQGAHRGALLLTLNDQSLPAPVPISFAASRSFVVQEPPPPPLVLGIDNVTYDETAALFNFDVTVSAPQQVGSLHVDVLDADNVQVTRLDQTGPILPRQTLRLNAKLLDGQGQYVLQVAPLSPSGRMLRDENGRSLAATYQFTYDPPRPLRLAIDGVQQLDDPAAFNFRSWRLEDDQPALQINLQVENDDQVAQYEGLLINLQGNQQWGDPFNVPVQIDAASGDATAQVPIAPDPGTYTLVLNALSESGQRLASARYTFSARNPDTSLARALKALQDNPLLWVVELILLILLALVAWRIGVLLGRRQRPAEEEEPEPSPVQAGAPPVHLEVLETPDPAFANGHGMIMVTEFPYTIGREGCDLSITGDRHISRRHAQITFTDGLFYIVDFGSSNGTFVNEARLAANAPTPLSGDIGAKIRVGKTTVLSFKEEEQ